MALWNFTVDDASPYLSYNPYGDGAGFPNGWQTWYTVSQFNTVPDQASRGDSYHVTSVKNANVTLQFIGTGVALFGFTNSSFDVVIDNDPRTTVHTSTTSDTLLYSNYSLTNELHSVTLSAQPSQIVNSTQTLAFDFAIVSTLLDSNENPPSALIYDSFNTAAFLKTGAWTTEMQDGVPNVTVSAPFQKTTEAGASMSFSFTGANAVAVKGLTSTENGIYSVSLDGSTNKFNGTSSWIIPDALLYFRAGLDPTSTHRLNITNLSSRLCLNSITVFKHEPRDARAPDSAGTPATKSHSSNKVGVVIGSVVGCLLLTILGLFLWYHRRRSQQNDRSNFDEHDFSQQLAFPRPQSKPESSTPPSTITSPMLATLEQDAHSTYDIRSAYNGSDRSSTHLLNASPGFGRQSIQSMSPSEAGSSQRGQMNPFPRWERMQDSHAPTIASNASADGSSASADSTRQYSNSPLQRTASRLPVASSSASEIGSSRWGHTPLPEYIPMSPRKPLPTIPVPSYDAALRAPQLTPDEVKDMSSIQLAENIYAAPPRYER